MTLIVCYCVDVVVWYLSSLRLVKILCSVSQYFSLNLATVAIISLNTFQPLSQFLLPLGLQLYIS